MVAERNFGGAELIGNAIENAAAQARAKPAHRLAGLDDARDDRVRVLGDDVVADPEVGQVGRQHVRRKPGLLLVEIDGDQLEGHRGLALQREQHVEQGVGILAAGQADHHDVPVLDHPVVADGLADEAAELGLELLETARRLERGGLEIGVGSGFEGLDRVHGGLRS